MEKSANMPAWTHVAEIEISYRSPVKPSDRPQLKGARMAYELLLQTWDMNLLELQEIFKVMYLNRNNRVLGIYTGFIGGTSSTVVDPKLILATALKAGASAMIMAHNHPSGSIQPSSADHALTKKIREGAAFMDINLLDHIIVTSETYFSFSDEGLL